MKQSRQFLLTSAALILAGWLASLAINDVYNAGPFVLLNLSFIPAIIYIIYKGVQYSILCADNDKVVYKIPAAKRYFTTSAVFLALLLLARCIYIYESYNPVDWMIRGLSLDWMVSKIDKLRHWQTVWLASLTVIIGKGIKKYHLLVSGQTV